MEQHVAPRGYQQLTGMSAATGLTLPVGPEVASATSASLSGRLLTLGGTVTGVFEPGQTVSGTGIPANTTISAEGNTSGTFWLTNACTTESGESVTAYQTLISDMVVLQAEVEAVRWRDDGTAPTSAVGQVMAVSAAPLEYTGDLTAIQFIQVAVGAIVDATFYKLVG